MKSKPQKRNIKQHYVPASYLAAFTPNFNRDSQLFVYERNTGKMFRAAPDNTAKLRNYYSIPLPDGSHDDSVDVMITALEGQAMPSLRKMRARDYNLSKPSAAMTGALLV